MFKKIVLLALAGLFSVSQADEGFVADKSFGAEMPQITEFLSLKEAIAQLGSGEEYVGIQGQVTEVCQAKGCWMILIDSSDSSTYARISFENYGFFVPVETSMQQSRIYGVLTASTLSQEEAQHFAEDAGEDPEAITGSVQEYAIVARAVQLQDRT